MQDWGSEIRGLTRTAILALACALLYVLSRTIPFVLKWLKYLCPLTAAIAPGGIRYRLRHAFVSSAIIGIALHPGEALSYFLLIGSFGLFFNLDHPGERRAAWPALSAAVYVLSFTAWLYAAPWLIGVSFDELAESLLAPRYAVLKPALDAAGISRADFMDAARRGALLTAASLGLTFYAMLYASNALVLLPVKRALRHHLEPPDGRPQAAGEFRQRTSRRGQS